MGKVVEFVSDQDYAKAIKETAFELNRLMKQAAMERNLITSLSVGNTSDYSNGETRSYPMTRVNVSKNM